MSKGPIIPIKTNLPIKSKWDVKIKNLNISSDKFVSSSDGKDVFKIPRDDNFIHKTNNIEEIKKISKDFIENLIKASGKDET